MRPRLGLAIAVSMAVIGAVVGAAVGAAAQQQRTTAAGQPAKPAQPSLFDKLSGMLSRAAPAAKPPAADPDTPQALPVNWAVAGRYAQSSKGGRAAPFIDRNRPAIDSLSVPVLLPGDPDLLAGMRLFPHGDFYTVSSNGPNGLSFVMSGHARAYPLPAGVAAAIPGGLRARIPADGILITETEVGRDAEFSRFGAAYTISLDCRLKQADPRCGSDAYLRGVVSRLVVVAPAGRS